ncbi:chloride channel protein [Sphingomonas sp. NFR15]|uniref:chloride channel protein n=1 Tax=Sphingomonas sp. NFR15 TaxID=1566282 RepID=UPI000887249B|nr:chloride channel protein [Sphingomonas sp. NFR15]SDA36844.1 H+/Cl-antiporter ClcA [Sphingomonas sp. NFR15]
MMLSPNPVLPARQLRDHSADRRMIVLAGAASLIGLAAAGGAWLLLTLIGLATNLFWFGRMSVASADPAAAHVGIAVVAIPVAGSLIVGLMARFGSDKIRGHGIPEAIEAILYGESRLSLKVAILKPLSSAISIGSGGPFGAEGPIIMTGGAIGSLFAQCFSLSAAERKTLLVAGAAAGMTGIFGTPLAAILLALEVLLFEWKPRSLVPVVIAVLVSFGARPFLLGAGPLFPFAAAPIGVMWQAAGLSLGLGMVLGVEAAVLSSLLYRVEDLFHRLPVHWMWWPAIGGLVVGLGGLIDAHVLGAGYANIQALLDGALTLRVVLALLVVKAIVWLVALGSGTSGGVLAPLLILGGALGALAGQVLPGPAGFWALIGMAGILSGAMRAPLTGAVFVVELTGHFDALPCTIAAAAGAYAVSVLVMRRSILTEKIARRGRHILQEYSVDPLEFLQAETVMTADPVTLAGDMPIGAAIDFFTRADHRSYPVVDRDGRLLALASRSDALRWQVSGALPETTLAEALSDASQPLAHPATPIGRVADLMVESGTGRIPIVDPATRRVVGILSRHDLLKVRVVGHRAERDRRRGRAPVPGG